MKYIVTVQEVTSKDIVISDAENEYDAINKVMEKYDSGELSLDIDSDLGVTEGMIYTCGRKEVRRNC